MHPFHPGFERFLDCGAPSYLVEIGADNGLDEFRIHELIFQGWTGILTQSSPRIFQLLAESCSELDGAVCLNVRCGGRAEMLSLQPSEVPTSTLTDLLHFSGCPADFGILLIRNDGNPASILNDFDFEIWRPALVAIPDFTQHPVDRREIYWILTTHSFRFSGFMNGHSIWLSKNTADPARPASTENQPARIAVAPNLEALPPAPLTYTLDKPTAGRGEVIRTGWGTSLEFEGWAFAESDRDMASSTTSIEFVNAQTGRARRIPLERCERSDVAAHFRDRDLAFAGFRGAVSFRGWHPGMYSLNIVLLGSDGTVAAQAANIASLDLALHDFEIAARAGLAAKFLSGSGIEIGALQRALPLPPSCTVRYIDRTPLADLLAHYPELAEHPLQEPDIIDDGETLLHIATASQDFVIANHFLEHCRNPIQTLMNFSRVLIPGGIVFMAVPDKRYTKDLLRPLTPYMDLLNAFRTGRREPLEILYEEWAENWENATGEAAKERGRELEATGYSIHFNVWDLTALVQFLINAKADVRLPFELTSLVAVENEVILILTQLVPTTSD